jgi:hypothetical protein
MVRAEPSRRREKTPDAYSIWKRKPKLPDRLFRCWTIRKRVGVGILVVRQRHSCLHFNVYLVPHDDRVLRKCYHWQRIKYEYPPRFVQRVHRFLRVLLTLAEQWPVGHKTFPLITTKPLPNIRRGLCERTYHQCTSLIGDCQRDARSGERGHVQSSNWHSRPE